VSLLHHRNGRSSVDKTTVLLALQAGAIVTKDKSASDASYSSTFKEVWSKRKREKKRNDFANKVIPTCMN